MAHFTDIQGLAFDLDGTLVDSAPDLVSALNDTLNDLRLPAAGVEQVASWIGNGAEVMISRALCWAQGAVPEETQMRTARTLFDRHYAQKISRGSPLFPQVKETLATLVAHGLPLAVITNKPTQFVAPLLEAPGIAGYFSLILGSDDMVVKKPHPASLFLVLGQFGLLPASLLFVGDSRNDILAAQAAGCPCVGMTSGYNYNEPIASSHPDLVLDHFYQLLPALGL